MEYKRKNRQNKNVILRELWIPLSSQPIHPHLKLKTMASHCSMRVILLRVSNGFSSKSILNLNNHRFLALNNSLSSLSSISPPTTLHFTASRHQSDAQNCSRKFQVRKISIFSPLCMGRRSSKIAGRKGAQDSKKAKLYCRIGKEVVSAVKKGGPNPVSNTALATILDKAKELDVPKEIVERNIKRASEKGQEAFIEKIYEVYGYGGVSMVVEVLTDKINRSVAAIRSVVKDYGGKMADSGSVMFKFRRVRVVNIKVTEADKDQLLIIALDAGAEDVIEPPTYEDDTDEDREERYYKIVTSSENYSTILSKLCDEGVNFEPDNGSELLPLTTVEVDDEAMELNKELMQKLLELDDVDAVYIDQK